jgi:hypothetical protein
MKKIPTLFVREFTPTHHKIIHNEVTPGCEWVMNGEGIPTVKLDGTAMMVKDGQLYKRYDAKHGKPVPYNAIPCQDKPDPVTGHFPCWVPIDFNNPADKWICYTFGVQKSEGKVFEDGTYELCGPHFQGNPQKLVMDIFYKHGCRVITDLEDRTFEGIKKYLEEHYIEGIVFHRQNETNDMCKIKRSDFGFKWR